MKFKFAYLLIAFTILILGASGVLIENAQASQPHMISALESLRSARHELEMARADKGGHREKAIGIIDEAIAEVKAGIDVAN